MRGLHEQALARRDTKAEARNALTVTTGGTKTKTQLSTPSLTGTKSVIHIVNPFRFLTANFCLQVERKAVPIVSTGPTTKFGLKNFLASASHMEKERMAQGPEKIQQPTSNKPKRSGFGPSALAVFANKT